MKRFGTHWPHLLGSRRRRPGRCHAAGRAWGTRIAVCCTDCAAGLLGRLGRCAAGLAQAPPRPAQVSWLMGVAAQFAMCAEARALLQTEGWHTCPAWRDIVEGARPPLMRDTGLLGDWPHGWHSHASRTREFYFRERVFLPTLSPAAYALVRSQSGPHAGAWLTAMPADPACALAPQSMQVALG